MNNRDRNDQNREYGERQQNQFAEGSRQSGAGWQGRSATQMGGSHESGYDGPHQFDETQGEYRQGYDRQRNFRSPYGSSDYRESGRNRDVAQNYEIPTYDASGSSAFGSFTSEDYGGRDRYGASAPSRGGSTGYGYRPSYDTMGRRRFGSETGSRDHHREYAQWRTYGESRGFLDRASDEIASWFGDEDAARRREMDHSGRGPEGYTRSDERIREDANDRLTHDWGIDARKISVSVASGEVTLDGHVDSRHAKRRAEDIVDAIPGVRHVQNNLRVEALREGTPSMPSSGMGASAAISDPKNATTDR